jgi:hypothetical protein
MSGHMLPAGELDRGRHAHGFDQDPRAAQAETLAANRNGA